MGVFFGQRTSFGMCWFACATVGAAEYAPTEPPTLRAWTVYNRSLAFLFASQRKNYQEADTQGLTADGTLDTERGATSGAALQARWQGRLGFVPTWVQAGVHRLQGQSDYSGYLQSGSALTSYRAKTGNIFSAYNLSVGVPWSPLAVPQLQLVPHLLWAQQRWQRNLVQYSESYRQIRHGWGLLAQWQPAPRAAPGWTLEASYQHLLPGQTQVSADALGFYASQGSEAATTTTLALHYQVTPRWGLLGQASQTQQSHAASATFDGLQAPPSRNRQTLLSAGLVWHY